MKILIACEYSGRSSEGAIKIRVEDDGGIDELMAACKELNQ